MYIGTRVTRLGEFAPVGQLFNTLGSLFKNYKSNPNVWLLFDAVKCTYLFNLTKNDLATFCAIFYKRTWSP
jgi:hypothetical protein